MAAHIWEDGDPDEIKGGSHGIPWTHGEEINNELVKFLS
jgi:hypothetical protein